MSSSTSPGISPKMNERAKDISLFDPDTKDSGFSEDSLEASEKLLEYPYQLDDEMTICFSPLVEAFEATPNEKTQSGKKKRMFSSPIRQSPSLIAANSMKRLRLFDSDTPNKSVASEDFTQDFLAEGSKNDDPLGPSFKIRKVEQYDARRGVIKEAVEKSSEGNLIGDFSKDYALPLINESHSELKMISADTMRDVLDGKYKNVLHSFKIIDSRYPYEYEGGHIRGAVNLYTANTCLRLLDNSAHPKDERHILIFHCEFSKERGPRMNRCLRKEDRTRNAFNYPALKFPEMYVLEGGYKKFFNNHPEYCEPNTYTPMLNPENLDDLKFFRKKGKTENVSGTSKKGPTTKMTRSSHGIRKTLSDGFF
ncbi:unnamed protein product [Ceutorhynchus assimilis]|uniref:protein-tyrosine-phosphatase n=1 Tax=Ceutorhynchus assimilis TaxID=467358 RepID=A0A9N9MW86_9CUCU|nr:unnamed protein product [Ceutorhynchus assimilis]